MPVAIRTKFLGPTNHRGSRVKAETCEALPEFKRSVTLSWDHSKDGQDNHTAAASIRPRFAIGSPTLTG